MPKLDLEDEKSDLSQAIPSCIEEVNTDSHTPPMESVSQVPDNESGFDDTTGTGEHLIPDDVDLPPQYLVTHSDDSSANEDTTITELNVDSQVNKSNSEDNLPFIDVVPKLGICPILRLGKPNLEFQVWVPILRLGKPNLESSMLPNLKIGQLHNLKIGLPKLGILND